MKIEVLYVADCPSHPVAVRLVKDILAAERVSADVREVLVADEAAAKRLKFRGSPTIRINGQDVEREDLAEGPRNKETFALSCRFYPGSPHRGLPPPELLQRALREFQEGEKE